MALVGTAFDRRGADPPAAEFIDAQYDTVAEAAEHCDVLVATAMSHFVARMVTEERSRGLTGLTAAQTAGTSQVPFWVQFAGVTTDVLFAAGAVAFGGAAVAHRRVTPSRLSDMSNLAG